MAQLKYPRCKEKLERCNDESEKPELECRALRQDKLENVSRLTDAPAYTENRGR